MNFLIKSFRQAWINISWSDPVTGLVPVRADGRSGSLPWQVTLQERAVLECRVLLGYCTRFGTSHPEDWHPELR